MMHLDFLDGNARCAMPFAPRVVAAGAALLSLAALAGSKELVVLHTLSLDEGIEARGTLVVGPDGALYGNTYWGGNHPDATGQGTLFRQTPGGKFSVIHTFHGTDGGQPNSSLTVGPDGQLWGTASVGGDFGQGVIFTIDTQGHYQVHYSFDGTHGGFVYPGVTFGPDGAIYGATTGGGTYRHGTLYRFDPTTGAYTLLHEFAGGPKDGEEPYASLVLASDGNLYGSTYAGNADGGNRGLLFRLTPQGEYTIVHGLNQFGYDGCHPTGPMIDGGDGKLYGTTSDCGAKHLGTVFSVDVATNAFTRIWDFQSKACGIPWQGLTLGADGLLYGTATFAGKDNEGCVFSLSTSGAVKYVHSFQAGESTGRPKAGVTFIGQKMYGVSGDSSWRLVKSGGR